MNLRTQTKVNEFVEQSHSLSDFLRSLQAVKQTLDQIRTEVADRKRTQDEVLRGAEGTLADLKRTQDEVLRGVEDTLAHLKRAQDEVLEGVGSTLAHLPKLDEICDIYILQVLDLCDGNRIRAAKILGIGRTSLYRYLQNGSCQNKTRFAFPSNV